MASLNGWLVSCPVSHPLVKSALEGAKWKFALPVRPKEPLSVDTVKAIANFYSLDVSLAVLRYVSMDFFVFMTLTASAFMI